ncbi:hypothetical protein [Chitinimonas lacunae]|uniref:HAMP domain-containing protein n=1 Tax=Chitinimonas lacunae TaxID=1963018 RepID=A0ABV8MPD1_9NEIS
MTSPPAAVLSRRPLPLWLLVGGMVSLVIGFVLALVALLNYANFRKNLHEQHVTRYLVLARDLRQTVEAGMNIGLTPAANERLPQILNGLRLRHSGISFAGLSNQEGRWLLGNGDVPEQSADYWRDHAAATAADSWWRARSGDSYLVGLSYVNNFGVKEGAVVIAYDRRGIDEITDAMLTRLAQAALATQLLFTLLSLIGAWLLTRRFTSQIDQVAGSLDLMARDEAVRLPPNQLDQSLQEGVQRFIDQIRAADRELARVEADPDEAEGAGEGASS